MEKKNARQLYLMRILLDETDEHNALTLQELIERMNSEGISLERRAIYSDLEALREFGIDVIAEKRGRNTYYYIGSRDFQIAELKLLVDSVQASRFITERKSRQLIKKLEDLAGKPQAGELNRQVLITGRIKAMNESIYYNVDEINKAINSNSKISFQYFQWDMNREMALKHNGKRYLVSPWGLVFNEENYYLVDFEDGKIKHYRVDKMLKIKATGEIREGREYYHEEDYTRKCIFGMYGGEVTPVTFQAKNWMVGILIDRFGRDIPIVPINDEEFETRLDIAVSPQFYGWLFALGPDIKVTAPGNIVKMVRDYGEKVMDNYK